jgi:cellulose synthase/poly-beta-1,6-N-acetylglucosamine synthase-like glycosyltransferase
LSKLAASNRILATHEIGTKFVTALVAILLAPFAVLTSFLVMEAAAGLFGSPARNRRSPGCSATIVVPAHDEAAVLGATLQALKRALSERMSIVVVADNCSDSTADVARGEGVTLFERHDPGRRGKGYALDFAVEQLASNPPDVLVIIDADCTIDERSLEALVGEAHRTSSPCQAVNLLRADLTVSPLLQLSTFAFMFKNLVRQRGLQRLAGRVHLTGTGMAMPFALFRASRNVRSSIVEDLTLGLELADSGHPPRLVAEACVWSSASTEQGTLVQRRRWEGGFLATALRHGPRALWRAVRSGDLRATAAALDLLVPPLALFALLSLGVLLIASVLTIALGASWWPVVLQSALLALALGAVFAAWLREGRKFVSLGVLARIPLYVLWKVPLYLGLARRGAPTDWLRTGR